MSKFEGGIKMSVMKCVIWEGGMIWIVEGARSRLFTTEKCIMISYLCTTLNCG